MNVENPAAFKETNPELVSDEQQQQQLETLESAEVGQEKAATSAKPVSAHKPWEKQQKKKSKAAKNKSKPKTATNSANKSKTAAAKSDLSTSNAAAAAASKQQQQEDEMEAGDEEGGGDESSETETERDEEELASSVAAGPVKKPKESITNNMNESSAAAAETSKGGGEDDDYLEKFQQMQRKKEKLETKAKVSHRVYCPYFPDAKQECWWLYVSERKSNSIICPPQYICTLKDVEEAEMKLLAPKTPGIYTYSVILRSDSYLDFDVIQTIKVDFR